MRECMRVLLMACYARLCLHVGDQHAADIYFILPRQSLRCSAQVTLYTS